MSHETDDLMMLQLCGMALAFSPPTRSLARPRVAHAPAMGLFDGFKKAFANQEYDAGAAEARSATVTSARAAHILTATYAIQGSNPRLAECQAEPRTSRPQTGMPHRARTPD